MESSFTSDHHAKSHCFLKIIISEISSKSKLMIPEKFVRLYGEELHGHVQLTAPGGGPWRVDVERKKGKIWLQSGWPGFAKFYSLCFGHFILFKYKGNCNFKVVILDKSATEIEYPIKAEKRTRGENDELGACKKKRVHSVCEEDSPDCLVQKLKKENCAIMRDKGVFRSPSKEECNKAAALASAYAFKSSYPFFIKVMHPSFVGKTCGWFARKADMETYMRDDVEVVILRLGGKTWLIKCQFESKRVKMGCGWQQFAEDNALAVGDVCVFELVNPSKKLLQVSIYRGAAGAPESSNG